MRLCCATQAEGFQEFWFKATICMAYALRLTKFAQTCACRSMQKRIDASTTFEIRCRVI